VIVDPEEDPRSEAPTPPASWGAYATESEIESKAVHHLAAMVVRAYVAGQASLALTLGQALLRIDPLDDKIRGIVGATACKLGRAKLATQSHRLLSATRARMLELICDRAKVKLTR